MVAEARKNLVLLNSNIKHRNKESVCSNKLLWNGSAQLLNAIIFVRRLAGSLAFTVILLP